MSTNDKFSRLAALRPARSAPVKLAAFRLPTEEDPIARLLGAGIATNHFGEHLAIRNWFSTPAFVQPSPVALELLTKAPASEGGRYKRHGSVHNLRANCAMLANPEKWLFLDTETTGLAGGTGTYAFLVGLAWWDSGGLQVEQLFLRDFSEEHSLLHELAARLEERPVLVTFNGKTFDWPLLESRFTMTRKIAVPKLAAHLDLLHPARAVWKLRLGSVRLVELERRVLDAQTLGYHRGGDVSSALIPQYYFDYLRGGSPDPLAGVVRHNQMDLRGLAGLFGKINFLLEGGETGTAGTDTTDLFGLSRFLNRRGDRERAHSVCTQALDAGLPVEYRPLATRELAQLAKRRGEPERAAGLWKELTLDPQDGVLACEQLAIHYERHAKDFPQAKEFAELALARVQQQRLLSRSPVRSARLARVEEKLMCRLARLRHRIKGDNPAARAPLLVSAAAAGSSARQRTR